MTPEDLLSLLENEDAMRAARQAVENAMLDLRDSRISLLGCGHGMVARERDGKESFVIRMATRDVLHVALTAMAKQIGGAQ